MQKIIIKFYPFHKTPDGVGDIFQVEKLENTLKYNIGQSIPRKELEDLVHIAKKSNKLSIIIH
jgi:hypothetical protein|tara:strand:- start:437 stop:625 length:189 start_codon:yes stop_codon:yes gene_type:complete